MDCPYFHWRHDNSEINNAVISCSNQLHRMPISQADNVESRFCKDNFNDCNHYKQYEEDKQMSKIQESIEDLQENQFSIMESENTAVTDSYKKAYSVHIEVKTNGELAEKALLNMCKGLKQIRDEELYKELGYSSFEDYVENNGDYSIKARQAYTYISTYEKLGPTLLQSNAGAGITKLSLLAEVPGYERAEFLEENDLSEISVRELQKELEKYKQKSEQIDLFSEGMMKAEQRAKNAEQELFETVKNNDNNHDKIQLELNNLRKKLSTLETENKDLKNKPVDVAVAEPTPEQLEKIKAEAKGQLEQEYQDKLHVELQKAEKEKSDLERKLKAGTADESKVAFKVYFQNIQENFRKFVEVIDTVEDVETKGKFKGAVKTYLNMMLEDIEKAEG